ncbi:MAG: TusE/DsrC/DsvC family sulfur relay protein, partial [Gammaproteobacteria bacterium]
MAETMDDILHPGLNAAPEGFPDAPAGWTPEDGKKALQKEGVSVDARHWEVVKALQAYYARNAHHVSNLR